MFDRNDGKDHEARLKNRSLYLLSKRIMDIVLSLGVILVSAPIFILIAVWVKIDSAGPVLYTGVRVGRRGRKFRMLKFRSMVSDADKIGGPSTSDDDPRVTRAGKFLRKYKLDELPELVNVLRGDMSIVGPRPEVPQEVELYSDKERDLLLVRPGITDYASIRFNDEGEILAGSADPHEVYRLKIRPEKIRLGLKYIHERSLWLDLQLIFKTLGVLFVSRFKKTQ